VNKGIYHSCEILQIHTWSSIPWIVIAYSWLYKYIFLYKKSKSEDLQLFRKVVTIRLICRTRFFTSFHPLWDSWDTKRAFTSPVPQSNYILFFSFSSISGCSFSIKFRKTRKILSFRSTHTIVSSLIVCFISKYHIVKITQNMLPQKNKSNSIKFIACF